MKEIYLKDIAQVTNYKEFKSRPRKGIVLIKKRHNPNWGPPTTQNFLIRFLENPEIIWEESNFQTFHIEGRSGHIKEVKIKDSDVVIIPKMIGNDDLFFYLSSAIPSAMLEDIFFSNSANPVKRKNMVSEMPCLTESLSSEALRQFYLKFLEKIRVEKSYGLLYHAYSFAEGHNRLNMNFTYIKKKSSPLKADETWEKEELVVDTGLVFLHNYFCFEDAKVTDFLDKNTKEIKRCLAGAAYKAGYVFSHSTIEAIIEDWYNSLTNGGEERKIFRRLKVLKRYYSSQRLNDFFAKFEKINEFRNSAVHPNLHNPNNSYQESDVDDILKSIDELVECRDELRKMDNRRV